MSSTRCLEDQQRALLAEVAAVEAEEARLFARKMLVRAAMDDAWNTDQRAQEQFGVLEAGTARIGQTRAGTQLLNGTRLRDDLPGTLAALQAGEIYRESVVLLLELTRNCTPEVVRKLERRVLPMILTANTTEVRRLVLIAIPEVEADLDPELTEQRLADARARRSVWQAERGDGMVDTTGQMDAISAKRWALDFDELVRAQKLADDKNKIVRTAEQRRADVFAQMPSRFLALLRAIARGETAQLLELAHTDPDAADHLEDLASTLPSDLIPTEGGATPGHEPHDEPERSDEPEPADLPEPVDVPHPPEDLHEQPPLLAEPPPDPALEPDPPNPAGVGHWTELQLA